MQSTVQYNRNYRPAALSPQLGKVSDLTWDQWALLGGGAIVLGAGLNTVVSAFPSKKRKTWNFIPLLIGGVVALVGGTAFVGNFKKLVA